MGRFVSWVSLLRWNAPHLLLYLLHEQKMCSSVISSRAAFELKLKLTRAGHWCDDSMVSVTCFKVPQLHVLRLKRLMAYNCKIGFILYRSTSKLSFALQRK